METTIDKAHRCKSTHEFIKHCHTFIHMCTEAMSKNDPDAAEWAYMELSSLIKSTTCNF